MKTFGKGVLIAALAYTPAYFLYFAIGGLREAMEGIPPRWATIMPFHFAGMGLVIAALWVTIRDVERRPLPKPNGSTYGTWT